jgi:hypothetical protein
LGDAFRCYIKCNVQVNFNKSTEIEYWAKKYNISEAELQRIFHEADYSIAKTILSIQNKMRLVA